MFHFVFLFSIASAFQLTLSQNGKNAYVKAESAFPLAANVLQTPSIFSKTPLKAASDWHYTVYRENKNLIYYRTDWYEQNKTHQQRRRLNQVFYFITSQLR